MLSRSALWPSWFRLCVLAGVLAAPSVSRPAPIWRWSIACPGARPHKATRWAVCRREAWLERQLHPGTDDGLPPQGPGDDRGHGDFANSRWNRSRWRPAKCSSPFAMRAKEQGRRPTNGKADLKDLIKPYRQKLVSLAVQAQTRSLLRDLYSRNQLKEQLTWFWVNHFNVYARKARDRRLVGDYEETAIRPHALGKFRDLLAATVFHPAMIQYLDNQQNAADKINENYAREIMELHTMGVGSGYTQAGRAGAGAHPDRRGRQSQRPAAPLRRAGARGLSHRCRQGRVVRVRAPPPRLWRRSISWATPSRATAWPK